MLRKIKAQLSNKFNVSVAECDDHDLWQKAVLGVSQIGNDEGHVDRCLREIIRFVDGMKLAELGEEEIEFVHL